MLKYPKFCKKCGETDQKKFSPTAPYCKICHAEWQRDHRLKRVYGTTRAEYEALKVAQGSKCAICNAVANGRDLHLDHSHSTGKQRGLLCFRCNQVLGRVHDDPSILDAMAIYLRV